MRTLTVSEAITRLEHLLPLHEPDLWASLQPPATPDAVDALRATIAPHDLPSDFVEVLSWRNGGPWGGPWWPILECGHLLSTDEIIDHYRWLCGNTDEWQWRRSWLPIAHDGWNQCGIELDGEQRGLVVNGSFPDPPAPWAPSLVAVLHATCAALEAKLPSQPRVFKGPEFESWIEKQAAVVAATYGPYGGLPPQLQA